MRRLSGWLSGAVALIALLGLGAPPAGAVVVRFDINEISSISALGGNLLFNVGGFEGWMTFEFVDTDADDILDTGTLVDLRLLTAGPIEDAPTSGFTMTLLLLPGNVDLLQIPDDGTEFTFTNALGDPETVTASNPVGGFTGDLFTFEPGAALAIEGAPESGIAGCTGDPIAAACSLIDPPPPIDLSGPQIPIQLEPEPSPVDKFKFTITGLETVEDTPASLTGQFEFFLGGVASPAGLPIAFTILQSSGTVVPEPDGSLALLASLGALAGLGRLRSARAARERSAA